MECKGFLFDLDGTLVDSLPAVERSWIDWAKAHGIEPQEVLDFIHGKQAITSLRHFLKGQTEEFIQREFDALEKIEATDTQGIVAMPGAKALLERLDELGIPWAIVTSGTVPIASARHRAGGLPAPKAFITAEQVAKGKPCPDAYLLGAQQLGLKPGECVVVEDAPAGVLSGLSAGCQVIAVKAPADTPKLDQVDLILDSLTQLRIAPSPDGARIILTR
ncbi:MULTISPECIES: sugar phosphatase [unclassified Brenneria]|uniref:sugar phosphatase n=1 Tax=unclassified Brenneria TaxID=2634434 RepID=UPI001552F4BD|nr:sugar phosphatase [Brenneria sp. L3-3C-1]MEE3642611.1 sugar phosphatase [Brenneria sp. L3_3C_1]MEE3650017.1 sugar phosphatase [Brenneria sp. HEZEL_4_2_4]NPC99975.1 sugar phosphatase [Brenneria sp. hezel4-2-4]